MRAHAGQSEPYDTADCGRRVTRALEQQAAADEKRSSGAPVTPHAVYGMIAATDCATLASRLLPALGPGGRPGVDPAGPGKENGRAAALPSPQQATPAARPDIHPHSRVRTSNLAFCLPPSSGAPLWAEGRRRGPAGRAGHVGCQANHSPTLPGDHLVTDLPVSPASPRQLGAVTFPRNQGNKHPPP